MLNKHNLSIYKLASKEKSRFTLNAIRVEKTRTAVTDGWTLMTVDTPLELKAESFPDVNGYKPIDDFKPFNMPATVAADVLKAIPAKSTIPILRTAAVCENPHANEEGHKNEVTVLTTDLDRHRPVTFKHAGNFPDIDRVIWKSEEAEFAINVNARLLADVLDLIAKMNNSKRDVSEPPDCVLRFKTNGEAIRIDAKTDEGQPVIALVIPTRYEPIDVLDSIGGLKRRLYSVTDSEQKQATIRSEIRHRIEALEQALVSNEG